MPAVEQDLTQGSVTRKLVRYALPLVASSLLQAIYSITDIIIAGHYIGDVGISAINNASIIMNMLTQLAIGLTVGGNVLVGQYFGSGDHENRRKSAGNMLTVGLIAGLLFAAGILLLGRPLLILLQSPTLEEATAYLSICGVGLLFIFVYNSLSAILRGVGNSRIPLYCIIASVSLNVVLDILFVAGFHMGVAGAALGTLISRAFEFAVICGYFLLRDRKLRFRVRDLLLPCGDLLPEYLRISLPVLVSDTLLGLGNSMTMAVAGHIGRTFMSANTITSVTQQITTVFTAGLGQAAVIITGNTLGLGETEKAQRQGVTFAVLGVLLGGLCGGIIVAVSPLVVGSYQITAETHAVAMELMNAVGVITVFMAVSSILTKGVLRGGGDTRFLMVADVCFLWVVSVPLGAGAGLVWEWPPFWIFFCLRIDHVIKAVWCIFRLRSGKWIKRIRAV